MKKQNLIRAFIYIIIAQSLLIHLYGQTNGPSQPEFRKFQPVELKDLVNEFTGAFTYNIPLMTVPGPNGSDYPIKLTYNSGLSPNEAASWVGFGWNLSPGAIIRNKRGWPDDFKNVNVKFLNRTRPNVTATSSITVRPEILSMDGLYVAYTTSNSFNTLNGFKNRSGVSMGIGFLANYNLSASLFWDSEENQDISFSGSISLFNDTQLGRDLLVSTILRNSLSTSSNNVISFLMNPTFSTETLNNFIAPNYGFTGIPTRFLPSQGSNIAIKPAINLEALFVKLETDFNAATWDINVNATLDATLPVYGYMYSAQAESDPNAIMDYSVERDGYYEKRDKFLGVPYSNADNFEVTGADVQGGFRLYQSQVGHFRPNNTESNTTMTSYGLMAGFGFAPFSFNFGGDATSGSQQLTMASWKNYDYKFNTGYWKSTDEKFFRFANDLGGALLLHDATGDVTKDKTNLFAVERADLSNGSMTPGLFKKSYPVTADRKSSSITYYTFGDYRNRSRVSADIPFSDIFRKQKINDFKGISDDLIAGFSIKGKNGFTYNYGLPVFSRNEVEYSYGLNKFVNESVIGFEPAGAEVPTIVYKRLYYANENTRVVMGNEVFEPYAGQFLLTEIYTSDYVDLTGDGPTEDDLGGYVKFNYTRSVSPGNNENDPIILNKNQRFYQYDYDDNNYLYKDNFENKIKDITQSNQQGPEFPPINILDYWRIHSNWYKWRIPYSGLSFHKNSNSDEEDDDGSVSAGETEIYYLESIETKTHVAIFITNKSSIYINKNGIDVTLTGSNIERKDGYSADPWEYWTIAHSNPIISGGEPNLLHFLERIELYSKAVKNEFAYPTHTAAIRVRDLLQTVYFQYDPEYSIWKGQKNSVNSLGKLTLKKIWTENEDVKDYRISPYEFKYKYENNGYPSEFLGLDDYGRYFVTNPSNIDAIQEPNYTLTSVDRWGAYRIDDTQVRYGNNSVSQKREGAYDFDPAAWNLKSITLPSKGEIHIQYEQNRYSFVGDQNAAVLTQIDNIAGNKIYVDVVKAYGCPENKADEIGAAAVDLINKKFTFNPALVLNNDTLLLYYKFLYKLNAENHATRPPLRSANYEYVNGYFKPSSAVYNNATRKIEIEFDRESIKHKGVQYYQSNRNGMFTDKDLLPSILTYSDDYRNKDWACSNANSQFASLSAKIDVDMICKDIAADFSYLRLPVPDNWSKLGGGIRTKRVLMFDKFESMAGSGNNRLYGTEYFYVDEKGSPSGVASNEPALGKEENALISILNKRNPDGNLKDAAITKLSFGPRDLEQFDGPLGEYLLPGPSIGYSSVYQKNIISGLREENVRFDGGVVRKQYFTTKDYPILKSFTNVANLNDGTIGSTKYYKDKINVLTRSQGYLFITNLMNGQPKSVETYAGAVFTDNKGDFITRYLSESPAYKTEYAYYDYKEPIPIYDGALTKKYWGVDEEIITESRFIKNYFKNSNKEADIAYSPAIPFFPLYVSAAVQFNTIATTLQTHVTNKILRFPAFLKSTTTTHDGIIQKIENYGFDCNTGRSVLTRSSDEFISANPNVKDYFEYNNITLPASQVIPQMSQFSTPQPRWVDVSSISNGLFHNWRRIEYDSSAGKNRYFLALAVDTRAPIIADSTELTLGNWECYYTQWYKKGDIIRVIPHSQIDEEQITMYHNARNSVEAEVYRIIDQKGHILELEPIRKSPYLVYPNSKMLSDIYILKNSAENLLNEEYGSFVTYGGKEKGYLNKIRKEFNMPPNEKLRRNRFNEFLNFALYAKSDGVHDNSSLYELLNLYSSKTGAPMDSLRWSFEGLDTVPVTVAPYNIDNFFELSATRKTGVIDNANYHKDNVTIYMDTLKIILFPFNRINAYTSDLNYLDYPFPEVANKTLDNLLTMRLDQAIPDVNWALASNQTNLDQKLIKRIFDLSGYTKLKNFALFFDNGIFDWKRLIGINSSNKKGKDILEVDGSSIAVAYNNGRAVIKDITMKVFSSDHLQQFKFRAVKGAGNITFRYNDNQAVHTVPYPSASFQDIFADPVPGFFTNNDYGFSFKHIAFPNFSDLFTYSVNLGSILNKDLGRPYSKNYISPDTITIKLMWSTDNPVSADNITFPMDDAVNVFHLDVEENRFFIDSVYGGAECDRYVKDAFGHPTSVFNKDVYPRTWFGWDLTALKFNTQKDTIINKAEFVDSVGNINYTHRLISGKLNYLSDDWPNPDIQNGYYSPNLDDPYSMSEKGKFRTKRDYIYDDYIDDPLFASNDQNQIITAARIQDAKQYPRTYDFIMFNPDPINIDLINNNWLRKNEIAKRLNDGRIVEAIDGHGIKNSFYYGYSVDVHNIWQPQRDINGNCVNPNCQFELVDSLIRYDDDFFTLTVNNAGYNEVQFQPWTASLTFSESHSGNSLRYFDTGIPEVLRGLKLGENSLWDGSDYTKGLLCRVWAKDYARTGTDCQLALYLDFYNNWPLVQTPGNTFQYPLHKVCQTGDWSLYEAEIRDMQLTNYYNSLTSKEKTILAARINTSRTDYGSPRRYKNVVCDDFIIQPISASVNAYVYNKENRRMDVMFDGNHFGSYFRFNDVGEPDKVNKETLAGFRTVAQSEFNTPGVDRLTLNSPMKTTNVYKGDPSSIDRSELENELNTDNPGNEIIPEKAFNIKDFEESKKKNRSELDDMFFNEEKNPVQEFKQDFDLFDLKISPDGQKFKIMNTKFDKDSLLKYRNNIEEKIREKINNVDPSKQHSDSLFNSIKGNTKVFQNAQIPNVIPPKDSVSSSIRKIGKVPNSALDSLKTNGKKMKNGLSKESIDTSLKDSREQISLDCIKSKIIKNIDSSAANHKRSFRRDIKVKK